MKPFKTCHLIRPGMPFNKATNRNIFFYERILSGKRKPTVRPKKPAKAKVIFVQPGEMKGKRKKKPTVNDDMLSLLVVSMAFIVSPLFLTLIFGDSFLSWFY